EHKNEYYRLLNAVTETAAWEAWVLFMLRAVETTARSTRLKVKAIQQLQEQVAAHLASDIGPQYPAKLSEILFEQPYSRVRDLVEGLGVSRPTATKYLHSLVDAKILRVQKAGRENLFVNIRFM